MKRTGFDKVTLLILLASSMIANGCSGLPTRATPTVEPVPEEEYRPVVSATGVVVPSQFATLSMEIAGNIAEVMVEEDDTVSADQILVRLEGMETLQAAISAANLELVSAQKALDLLYENPELRIAQASEAIINAERAIDDAQERLDNLNSASDPNDIDQARANLVLARDQLDKAREDYEPYANKPEDNLARAAYLSRMAQAEKVYEAASRLLNNLLGDANALDLAEAEANLELAKAQLVTAQRDFETLKESPDPDDIALAEVRLENAKNQLAAAQSALDDLELHAPFSGTVSELNVRPSEWVVPGQPILLLADLSLLRVETTDLNEIDVAQLEVEDEVKVTFDALPGLVVPGSVIRISSKSAKGSGVNYKVVIELEEIPPQLRWGMTAFVDIAIGE